VGDDLFYRFRISSRFCLARHVDASDLQAVEEKTRAFWINFVAGDTAEDFADRALNGGTVFGEWQIKGRLSGFASAWVLRWFSGGVMVVAKFFSAQAWAAAASTFSEDVTALEALGCV